MNFIQLSKLFYTTITNLYYHHTIKAPAIVRINLTNDCNLRCQYCGYGNNSQESISLNSFKCMIDTLSKMGTYAISISGGEPLVHPEIDNIINYASAKKSIRIHLNSNGILIKKKVHLLNKVKQVRLSLDGTSENHDKTRGIGSHKSVLEAIEILKDTKTNFFLNTTLNRYNVEDIQYILDFCIANNTRSFFQPATRTLLANKNQENDLALDHETHAALMDKLILLKKDKKYRRVIDNSVKSLKLFRQWPAPTPIPCFAGRFFFQITNDLTLHACPRTHCSKSIIKNRQWSKSNLRDALNQLTSPNCQQCWCNLAEINYHISKIIHPFRR